ncbi:MAG: Virginiamycin B lyase [Ktedonobacterales bacterium]
MVLTACMRPARVARWSILLLVIACAACGSQPAATHQPMPTVTSTVVPTPTPVILQGHITEFRLPSLSLPSDIVAGPDGAMWFAAYGTTGFIGRIAPNGKVTGFALREPNAVIESIAVGPDGALWFTSRAVLSRKSLIGRITTSGAITEYPLPAQFFSLGDITAGPDGALWFTEYGGPISLDLIGRITTRGTVTQYPVLTPSLAPPPSITAGPDGALWFTAPAGWIGRITTSGRVTEFPLPSATGDPRDIVSGPDGALWFTELEGNKIGRITQSGTITEFPLPKPNSGPAGITLGPDGALWFTEAGVRLPSSPPNTGNRIGRITLGGVITEFTVPTPRSSPEQIAASASALWFTENAANQIGLLT